MTTHKNDITIGNLMRGTITVSIYGPLSVYAEGLRRKLSLSNHVKDAYVLKAGSSAGECSFITIDCDPLSQRLNEQQVRIWIRDWCRDWILTVTGHHANTGAIGDYVDLIEESTLATI